jgi:hypothetical protein
MTLMKQCKFIFVLMVLAFILSACNTFSNKPSNTSPAAETTDTSEAEPTLTTPVEVTPVKNEPQIPDGPGFDVDWIRPLEIIASQENVIIVGNGNIHVIEGYVPGSYTDYYPQVGDFYLCGTGRNNVDHLPTIQYSVDRSVVGLKLLEDDGQSYFDPGKLILYDGTNETVVAQDVFSFSLSADGQRIAYLAPNEVQANGDSLFLYDLETGESTLLSECAGPSYVISILGRAIVYTEYTDASSTESWRVILKLEGADNQELTQNMFPIAVSDDGLYAYALQEDGEDTCKLWSFKNGKSECIGNNVQHTYMHPILFNCDCSQVIFCAGDTYFSRNGKKGVRLDISGSIYSSTALFHVQYMMHVEETFDRYTRPEVHYLCTDSLMNVVHEKSNEKYRSWLEIPDQDISHWFFDENLEVSYVSAEEVYQLYDGHDEYLLHLDKIIEQEAYAYRLHETIYLREDEPDMKYYLDTENGGRNAVDYLSPWIFETSDELRQSYINAHYFDLYMLEAPFDGTPIKVAENVSQVWSDEFGVYYICLEEIGSTATDYFVNPSNYIYEDLESGTMMDELGAFCDKNGLYYCTDAMTFQRAAYTLQSYVPTGMG